TEPDEAVKLVLKGTPTVTSPPSGAGHDPTASTFMVTVNERGANPLADTVTVALRIPGVSPSALALKVTSSPFEPLVVTRESQSPPELCVAVQMIGLPLLESTSMPFGDWLDALGLRLK